MCTAYLEMAIGNGAWPLGVTQVGIHSRTGRERISSSHVAHVLNDETARKFIQVIQPSVRAHALLRGVCVSLALTPSSDHPGHQAGVDLLSGQVPDGSFEECGV